MERLFTISHADLLSNPSPNYWKNPCPTIGEALAQLLEKPLPNYWRSPRPTIGKTLAQLLEKPSPNYWKNPCPTIGEALAQLLEKPNYWQLQQLKMPKNFCWARKRPSPTNVTINKKNTEKTMFFLNEKEITIIWTITLMKLTWSVNNQSIDPIMWSDY